MARHWVVGGIGASLAWFLAGRQSLSNKNPDAAIGWQCVAAIIILIVCGWAVVEKEWVGLAFALVVLYMEVRSIKRISATRDH